MWRPAICPTFAVGKGIDTMGIAVSSLDFRSRDASIGGLFVRHIDGSVVGLPDNGPSLYVALVYVRHHDSQGKAINNSDARKPEAACKVNVARVVFFPLDALHMPGSKVYTDWTPVTWDALQMAVTGRGESLAEWSASVHRRVDSAGDPIFWNAFALTEPPSPGLVPVYWDAWQRGGAVICKAETRTLRTIREYAKLCSRVTYHHRMNVWRIGASARMVGPYVVFNISTGFETTETVDIDAQQIDRWCATAFTPKRWGLLPESAIVPDPSLEVRQRGALVSVVQTASGSEAVCVYPSDSPDGLFHADGSAMVEQWIAAARETFVVSSHDLLKGLEAKGVKQGRGTARPVIVSWNGATGRVDPVDEDAPSLYQTAMVDDIVRIAIDRAYVAPLMKGVGDGELVLVRPAVNDYAVMIEVPALAPRGASLLPQRGDAWAVIAPMHLSKTDLGRRTDSGWSLRRS